MEQEISSLFFFIVILRVLMAIFASMIARRPFILIAVIVTIAIFPATVIALVLLLAAHFHSTTLH